MINVSYILRVICEGKIHDLYMEGMLLSVPREREKIDFNTEMSFKVVGIHHKNGYEYVEVDFEFLRVTKERYLKIKEVGFKEIGA